MPKQSQQLVDKPDCIMFTLLRYILSLKGGKSIMAPEWKSDTDIFTVKVVSMSHVRGSLSDS